MDWSGADERRASGLAGAVEEHARDFFLGHSFTVIPWTEGPVRNRLPELKVLAIAPGPRTNLWTYLSLGACWVAEDAHRAEFFLLTKESRREFASQIARTAFYHAGPPGNRLGVRHMVPMGEPWVPGSACQYSLISLPYPFGPELERCPIPEGHVQLLWELPITNAEHDFAVNEGVDALEHRFEEQGIEYWDPFRDSIV